MKVHNVQTEASLEVETVHQVADEVSTNGFSCINYPAITEKVSAISEEVGWLINRVAEREGVKVDEKAGIERRIVELAKHKRSLAGTVYDAVGRLTSVHKLSVDDHLLDLSKMLLGSDRIQAAYDKALRIDLPAEDRYLFPWHQDYIYDPSSPGGLVYWIPMVETSRESGAIEISPRSHLRGIRRVRVLADDTAVVSGAKMYEVSDLSDCSNSEKNLFAELKAGQILVFSNLLMHRSTPNISTDARWTIQIRHGDFAHSFAIEKGWPHGSFRNKWFYDTHPEYVDTDC